MRNSYLTLKKKKINKRRIKRKKNRQEKRNHNRAEKKVEKKRVEIVSYSNICVHKSN